MLQVFYMDVAKVERDVAHVIMAIHVMHVPNVSSVFQTYVYKYFVLMLYMFHANIARVFI
jgi:hypothetical protein